MLPERSRSQDVPKLNQPANAPVKNYALVVLNQLFLSLLLKVHLGLHVGFGGLMTNN
jgi:hypothetical protein